MGYYVFDTQQEAEAAEAYISSVGGAPIVGINAKTGMLALGKQKTEHWATPQQRLDGKWIFPKVPIEILNKYSQEEIDAFSSNFNFSVEEFDTN